MPNHWPTSWNFYRLLGSTTPNHWPTSWNFYSRLCTRSKAVGFLHVFASCRTLLLLSQKMLVTEWPVGNVHMFHLFAHCYVAVLKGVIVSLEMLLTAHILYVYICIFFVSHHAGRVTLNGKVSTVPLRKCSINQSSDFAGILTFIFLCVYDWYFLPFIVSRLHIIILFHVDCLLIDSSAAVWHF